jgi:hypothetical protein
LVTPPLGAEEDEDGRGVERRGLVNKESRVLTGLCRCHSKGRWGGGRRRRRRGGGGERRGVIVISVIVFLLTIKKYNGAEVEP